MPVEPEVYIMMAVSSGLGGTLSVGERKSKYIDNYIVAFVNIHIIFIYLKKSSSAAKLF